MTEQHYHDPANITNPEHAEHHIVTPKTYGIVFVTLLVVILFFMHVYFQSNLIKMTVGAGFFTFLALVTMSLSDYMSRAWGLW
jgi:cytochrome c oxidase subunit 4